MKNKLLVILISICVATATIGLTACGGDGPSSSVGGCNHEQMVTVREYKAPSCEEDGNQVVKQCSNCELFFVGEKGEIVKDFDEAMNYAYIPGGHDLELVEMVSPADCETDGVNAHQKCKNCEKLFDAEGKTEVTAESLVITAGHNLTYVSSQNATCIQEGVKSHYRCTECFKYFDSSDNTVEITAESVVEPKLEHETSHTEAVATTCLRSGNIEYWYCYSCYKYYSDEDCTQAIEYSDLWIDQLSHEYTDVKVIQEAGCEIDEIKRYTCVNGCEEGDWGHYYDEITNDSATGHNFVGDVCKNCGCDVFTQGLYIYTQGYGDDAYAVVGGLGEWTPNGVLTIPNEYKGYPVRQVSLSSQNLDNITKVIIPENVENIYLSQYYNEAHDLTKIEIHSSKIEYISVYNLAYLKEIEFTDPNCVIHEIGEFSDLDSIETLTLKGDYTEIKNRAFDSNRKLKNITLSDNITKIDYYAFRNCESLEKILDFKKLETIGSGAFENCKSLKEIYIPSSVTKISQDAFENCVSLEKVIIDNVKDYAKIDFDENANSTYVTPKSNPLYYAHWLYKKTATGYEHYGDIVLDSTVYDSAYIEANKKINGFAFAGCYNITKVIVPTGITAIGKQAFENCERLIELELHPRMNRNNHTITTVGVSAFEGCKALDSVSIANTMANFGSDAFKSCNAVTKVYYNGTNLVTPKWLAFNFNNLYANPMWAGNATLYTGTYQNSLSYYYGEVASFDLDPLSGLESYETRESVTIPQYAFAGMNATINNLEYASSIGDGAFYNAKGVKGTIYLNEYSSNEAHVGRNPNFKGCTSIGYEAFYGCENLNYVYLPSSAKTTIGDYAFANTGLQQFKTNNSSITFGKNILEGCNKITYFEAPYLAKNSSTSTDTGLDYFFGNNIPTKLNSIGLHATVRSGDLDGITNLQSVYVDGATRLNSGTFGQGDNQLGGFSLFYRGSLEQYIKNANVINDYDVFKNVLLYTNEKVENGTGTTYKLVRNLEFPESVTTIGYYKFAGITSIETVVIPQRFTSSFTYSNSYAFYGCSNLLEVYNYSSLEITPNATSYGHIARYAHAVYTVAVADRRVLRTEDGYIFGLSSTIPSTATLLKYVGTASDITLPSVFMDSDENNDGQLNNYDLIYPDVPGSGYASGAVKYQNYDIASSAFANNKYIKSVTFPVNELGKSTVQVIGAYAFEGCSNLNKVVFQEGLKSIKDYAFRKTAIKTVVVPDSVTELGVLYESGSTKYYQYSPFDGCYELYQIVIGANSPYVKNLAEDRLVELVDRSGNFIGKTDTGADIIHSGESKIFFEEDFAFINIDGEVTLIGYSGSETEITLPEIGEDYVIGEYFLKDNTTVTKVVIPDDVTKIGLEAFYNSKVQEVVIGDGVKEIGVRAFEYASDLTKVEMGNNVEVIKNYAFAYTGAIEELVLPASLKTIASYAFSESGVQKIVINDGFAPTEIENTSFILKEIKEVHVSKISTLLGFDMNSSFFASNPKEARLYINGELVTELTITAQDGNRIPKGTFNGLQGIDKVTIDGVKEIGYFAFRDAEIIDVVIKNVDLIDTYAFSKWSSDSVSIESVVLENVKVVGGSAFYNNRALDELTMTGVEEVQAEAFDRTGLSRVVLPDTIKVIGDGAFSTVSSVVLVDSIEELGNAFGYVSTTSYEGGNYLGTATNPYFALMSVDYNVTEITLHKDTKHVAGQAFYNMSESATKVELNEGLISIGNEAFKYKFKQNLRTVTLPSTLKYIGDYAFSESGLTSIVIPKNVERVGSYAFSNCSSLETATLTADGKLDTISSYMFNNCNSLSTITLPDNVAVIEKYAFNRVKTITFGNGLELIEAYAFGETYDRFIESIYVSSLEAWLNITMEDAFHNSANLYVGGTLLTEVVIPETVKVIKARAFSGNSNIISVVGSSSLETIENNAFYDCYNLASVDLGGAKYIGNQAFYYCSNLVSISAPNAVTIGESAFREIGNVTSLTLGASLTEIGKYAFGYYQTELTSGANLYFNGTANDWAKIKFANETANPLAGNDSLTINFYLNNAQPTEITISTETVGDYAFYNIPYINKVTFTDTVKNIGQYAFYSVDNLVTIDFGKVETIGDNAFYNTYNISEVTNTNSIKYIGVEAFMYSGINSIDLSSIITVGEDAFYEARLESVIIGENFESSGSDAFLCSNMGSVDFRFSLEELATKSFANSYANPAYYASTIKFNGVAAPETVTFTMNEIKPYAYAGMPFTNVTLSDGVKDVGDGAFYNNKSLTTVVMADSITELGTSVFYGCIKLSNVTLSKNIAVIKNNTFVNNAIVNLVIPDSVEVIEERAFNISGYTGSQENISKTKTLHIGKNLRDIGNFFNTNYYVTEITIDSENKNFVIEDGILYNADKSKLIYCFDKSKVIVEVPTGVKTIGHSAFRDSKGIAVLVLPTTLTTIDSYAFLDCDKLVEIINLSNLSIVKGNSGNGYVAYYAKNVVRSLDSKTYSVDENGFVTVTIDGANTLVGYVGDEIDITVPSTVTKIYKYALSGLELDSLTITNINTTYENYSFSGLKVTNLNVPAGALNYLNLLVENLTINGGVITVSLAQTARNSIKTLTLGENVTFNSNKSTVSAFANAKNLKTVTINCAHVDDNTFKGCSALETVNVSKNTKTFDSGVFYESKAIKTVNYAGTVDEWVAITFNRGSSSYAVGANPLYYGASLYANGTLVDGEVSINTSTINSGVLENYRKASAIILGDNVTTIGDYAFAGMKHLTHVTVGSKVTTIGTNAFYCDKIVDIYNKSSLNIKVLPTANSTDFGRLGYNALNIYTSSNDRKITYSNGFAIMDYGQRKALVDYYGTEQNIVIPSSVTELSFVAFRSFKADYLEDYTTATLTVPASVTLINRYAFHGSSFNSITFNEVKNWYTVELNYNRYLNVRSLDDMTKDIMLDRSYYYDVERLTNENGFLVRQVGTNKVLVKYVGDAIPKGSLSETTNVTLTIPEGVVEIGSGALGHLNDDEKLNVKLIMPSTLCRIAIYAFVSSDRITEIDLTTNGVNSLWYRSTSGYLGSSGTVIGSDVTTDHELTAKAMIKDYGSTYYYHLPGNDDEF